VSSIRRFLLLGVLAALTLFSFVAALRGYESSMREAETLFDRQLLDLSQLVANLDEQRVSRNFRLGNNLAFQIWADGSLLAASLQAPREPMTPLAQGFDNANFGGYRWRTYTRFDEDHDHWVMVAERTDLRFLLAENVVLETVVPILLGIPVTGLLIWFIVSRGLRPLLALSAALQAKPAHDLSPLRGWENPRELRPVVSAINGLINRLGAALEREKRLSADAAHELRTPIAALRVQLHNLAQEVDASGETFQQLQQGVERMQHLVDQLMALYRASPEQFATACRPLDLHALGQEVIARLYPLFEAKQQSIELAGDSALVLGERFALETLMSNLLINANKYTGTGGRILMAVDAGPGGVDLLVQDDGPGIEPAEQQKIFERFYRSGRGEAITRESGCGLGLTIVQHVADIHHASVSVGTSGFGHGAAFSVHFPPPADTIAS
jgi:two-component system sensor histidine kinase QseC